MLHPTGPRSPSVYWRRRFVLSVALLGLIVLTAWVLRPGGDGKPAAGRHSSPSDAAHSTPSPTESSASSTHRSTPTKTTGTTKTTKTTKTTSTTKASKPAGPAACPRSALKVAAVVGQSSYRVGQQPVVLLQVTNTGSIPCVQDLSDSQVELRVYNGESRVWGSHDCTIQPGTSDHTLAAGQAVRVSIVWSGLSSQPKCTGTRQRVGAGTYTLYALLSGHEGTAAQFSIS